MEKELRKWQSILTITGKITIAIGLWDIIRLFISLFLQKEKSEESDLLFVIILVILYVIIVIFSVGMRVFIGLSAISEGKGKNVKHFYIVVAIILAVLNLIPTAAYIFSIITIGIAIDTLLVSAIIDFTTLFIYIEMIVSSSKVKKLSKSLKKGI